MAASASGLVSQFATVAGLALIAYVMFKLDWTKIMHRMLNGKAEALNVSSINQPKP